MTKLRQVLINHWLTGIECDHARKMDRAGCSCSLVDLGWHASVGRAVDSWIDHIEAELTREPAVSLSEKVRAQMIRRRGLLGLSQSELGRHLGVSHAAISDIERGKTRINFDLLERIAAQLFCSVEDLMTTEPPVRGAGQGGGC